jgi:hypothetical protein
MRLYSEDAKETDKPWERWEWKKKSDNHWKCFEGDAGPGWVNSCEYRRKPKTIKINGIEVPEPVREKLDRSVEFYMPELNVENLFVRSFWTEDIKDYLWLQRGIIHLTKEAAILHAKALLSFTEVKE